MAKSQLDKDLELLVRKYGVRNVIASLARHCNDAGMPTLFRRLNKIYEWLVSE